MPRIITEQPIACEVGWVLVAEASNIMTTLAAGKVKIVFYSFTTQYSCNLVEKESNRIEKSLETLREDSAKSLFGNTCYGLKEVIRTLWV